MGRKCVMCICYTYLDFNPDFFFPTDFLFDLEGIIMMIKAGIIDLWELNEIIYNIYKYILFATLTYEYILISSERI